ncbi:MAG: SufE family protein [Rikenellaceae bacterium]
MNEKLQNIVDEFELLPEWLDKYNYLIELADGLAIYPDELKTEEYLIAGCQSRVWIKPSLDVDGKIVLQADSDAIIVKGIASLLVTAISGLTPQEVEAEGFEFLDTIGLKENLSPTRAGGLVSMIEKIKAFAQSC